MLCKKMVLKARFKITEASQLPVMRTAILVPESGKSAGSIE
jgi:hypothetical protein